VVSVRHPLAALAAATAVVAGLLAALRRRGLGSGPGRRAG
jgi:hypothetical protein